MKTYCFECKHDCHCGRKCNQCSCYICNDIVIKTYEDYMGGNMIKKIWKKIKGWFKPNKVIEKCAVHVARFKKSCPRCQQLNQLHGQIW